MFIYEIYYKMKNYSILIQFSLIFAFGFSTTVVIAQSNFIDQEDIEFSKKWEAKLNHAISSNHFQAHRSENSTRSCLSTVILEGVKNKKRLTDRVQKLLRTYENRPVLNFSFDSQHYRFHYNKTGNNAVSATDNNNNALPDYVEFMATQFENVYTKEISGLGFSAPPNDGSEGGSNLYDVYISNIQQGVYGFVSPEDNVGDNPNSAVQESEASTSWIAMRNNYEGFGIEEEALKVTAAHEFFHAIQMGYNSETPSIFAFEGTAVWMEEEIYPRIDDNFQYLNSVFGSPDVAVNYNFLDDGDPDYFDNQNFWYGSWIFFQYIGENYGKQTIRKFWENIRTEDELESLREALVSQNTSLITAFEDFFVANLVLSASPSFRPYNYARAADYISYLRNNIDSEKVKIEGTINLNRATKTWSSTTDGNRRLMRFSADYIKINTQQEFIAEITSSSSDSKSIGLQFVSFEVNGRVRVIKNFPTENQRAEIEVKNINSNEQMYLIVYRLGNNLDDFSSEQYTLIITSTSSVTGIEDELGEDNYFRIASNPISNDLRFIYKLENQNIKNYNVNITDALGRTITKNKSVRESIDTSQWAKGAYFVTLLNNQKPIVIRKIIVQ